MKSFAAATLFATVVLAQSASLIPSGISSACSDYLTTFNNDNSLSSCTSSIINATSAFAPSTNASAAATTHSSSSISTALNTVCSSASTCSTTTIRSALADFYTACSAELTAPNAEVVKLYDALYAITPYKQAICSKDDSGSYCANQIAANASSSTGTVASISKFISSSAVSLTRRATAQSVVALQLNATTFADNNLLFLLLQPSLSSDALCTTCTRNIITSYISFESSTPYAPGLNNSVLLAGQSALYNAVQTTCGSSFLSGAVAAAAGLSGGVAGQLAGGAASLMANTGVTSAIMGAIVLALTAAL
ncbi:hypothetical protein C2E23DRAFT_831921 [Lenzites betulinus]|nr:hypothetical protein C2E23DRAFT_831921 [Lenzites betulinus]